MKSKKIIIIVSSIVIAILTISIGLYNIGLSPVKKDEKQVILYTLNSGTNKMEVVKELKSAGLIKSKLASTIYVIINRNLNLQAGEYELTRNMSTKEILQKMNDGKIKEEKNTFNLTFVEGKKLVDYAEIIAGATDKTKEEVLSILSDKDYLKELIEKYDFITDDILAPGIYYPLEGYLFPSTYEFYNNSSVKDIVGIMLDTMESKLKSYSEEIENSKYSIHEILTMASIIELEGSNSDDRAGVAGVFYNRLKGGWSLGSDVTTYYAARKEFYTGDLTWSELNNCSNGYNTRCASMAGKLPVGPICSPSASSLLAAINPESHDYYYFVADKYKKTYFTKTESEHIAKVAELKANGMWYEYN